MPQWFVSIMSKNQSLQRILTKAEKKEKEFSWLDSAKFYEKALDRIVKLKDFLKSHSYLVEAGDIQERIGFCFYRAAMQAENQEEFRERTLKAIQTYEKARRFYEKSKDEKSARMSRCGAFAKFLDSLIASDASEKRTLRDESLELIDKALAAFSESKEMLEYGRTYNGLPFLFFWRIILEWDKDTLKTIVKRGLEWGEKAVAMVSEMNDLYEVAKTHLTMATCLMFLEAFIEEPEEKEINRLKIVNYLNNAVDVFESIGDRYLLGWSHLLLGANTGEEESIRHFEKVVECGKQTHDNLVLASGHDLLSYMTYWKAIATEDPDQRIRLAQQAMRSYDEAQHHLSIVKQVDPRGVFMRLRARARAPPASHAEHYLQLSMWETNLAKRQKFLEKAEKAFTRSLKVAEDSDIPYVVLYFLHVASKVLEARARTETNRTQKKERLENALKYRNKAIKILERLAPFDYYAQGVMQNHLAEVKARLVDIEPTTDGRLKLLEEAVVNKEKSLTLCDRMIPYFERMGDITFFAALQPYQDTYATLLTRLYNLSSNPEYLRKAIEIHERAIESASKVGLVSLIAESYWKIGKAYDVLGELMEAAQSYEVSSANYINASQKISQLKDFYQDHASYMEAWSEIEKARDHHAKSEYGEAREHYEKAADLHKSTGRWKYLSSNYYAWAQLELAEDRSRSEQTEKARSSFKKAAKLFAEAKKSIKAELEKIGDREEKEMMAKLVKASDVRYEYCLGRIALEEAKILDRQGDPTSSRKYGTAAGAFQKAMEGMEHEPDRRELRKEFLPIIYLSQAWQTMSRAEVEVSPDLYLEASQLFEKAKEHSTNEKARLLALGHSYFCRALESGARFEGTRDPALHLDATHHLERAANYYVRAGFKTASEHAMATQRLFDAYVYMDNAKKEMDPEKKARYYMVAEKVLQTSIGSFLKAKHPAKSDQVQQLLEKVRAEKELAISLSEVLYAPTITSSTTSFVTPAQSQERSVGLEKFEHANVQAKLTLPKSEVRVGEDFDLEIQIGNVGKEAVLLARVEEILPKGFELAEIPEARRTLRDTYLDMKGIQLNPRKTEEIRLALRTFQKGTFEVKPRIVYVGETGEQMISKPDSVTIKIREAVLPNRVTTGHKELDAILFGGVPKNFAIILTSPSCDERNLLVDNFLKARLQEGEVTFYITLDPGKAEKLAEDFPNFYLFVCNPQADKMVKSRSNIFKLKGVENLTEISIALTSAFRRLDEASIGSRRACLRIVSDVLLQHHAVQTRRWLTSLIPELRSRGFTILAVMDPQMHPPQEARAILDLFEGEISMYETEAEPSAQKYLKIKKMTNQKYLETTLRLRKARLQQSNRLVTH